MEQKEKYFIVEAETGNVVDTISQEEGYKKLKRQEIIKTRDFNFSDWGYLKFSQGGIAIMQQKSLTNTEWALFWYLVERIRFTTCEIKHENGRYLRTDKLAEIFKVSISTINRALNKFEEIGIIARRGERPLKMYFNPYLAMRGSAIPKKVSGIFSGSEFYKEYDKGNRKGKK